MSVEGEPQHSFTSRQRQIAVLVSVGYSNEEIGKRLGISARTARAHCDALRLKLDVDRRRLIPLAYFRLTGEDPFEQLVGLTSTPERRPTGDLVTAETAAVTSDRLSPSPSSK